MNLFSFWIKNIGNFLNLVISKTVGWSAAAEMSNYPHKVILDIPGEMQTTETWKKNS